MTLFTSFQPKQAQLVEDVLSPLTLRLLRRLALSLLSTFGIGSLLAHYAVPGILESCVRGEARGLAEAALLYLWLRSLADMWRRTVRDLLHTAAIRRSQENLSLQPVTADSPKI